MSIRVLIVDDVAELRALYKVALSHGDIEIVGEAADGFEAVEQTQALRPDVVLLDIAMPNMDGLAAIPKLKSAHPAVKILCLSGFASQSLAEQALARCANDYLEKGAHIDTIVSKLHKVVKAPPKVNCPK